MGRVPDNRTDVKGTFMNDVIARYLACWNETDPAVRRKLIEETWAEDATYIDPLADARGRDAIDATIAAAQGQFPGYVFALAGPVDAHHQQARFTWGLGPEGAEPLVVGFDVAVTDDENKIRTVLGFLDKVPA
jgi:SnoaL-like domain